MASEENKKLNIDSNILFDATQYLLKRAKDLGASEADCSCDLTQNLDVSVRMGALENVERSETISAGLRVIIGKSQAGASTSSLSKNSLDELAQRVVSMARLATPDPYCGLCESDTLETNIKDLNLIDFEEPNIDFLESQALICEEAAMKIQNVSNIAGCGASWNYGHFVYGASNGFLGGFGSTTWGLGIAPIAQSSDDMQRDFESNNSRLKSKLKSAKLIGEMAGNRAASRLNPKKINSMNAPVVIEARVAKSIIGLMISAISGSSIARGISFLKDKLNSQIFNSNINIIDNPFIDGGWGSKPFDGEGAKMSPLNIIENGILKNWLLNSSSAKQLGLKSNSRAGFAQGGPHGISISNFTLMPSSNSREELFAIAKNGIFVTEAMSPSFNPNNGDYSVGISGFMIENGELSFPISEITIAGNIIDIYKSIIVANDLEGKSALDCPSILIESMTIAGA